jgi:hypothetical protein
MLTTEFLEGYNSSQADIDNPYLWSSDTWLAYMAGADFAKRGSDVPVRAKKSFGYVIRVWTAGGNEYRVIYGPSYQLRAIERA